MEVTELFRTVAIAATAVVTIVAARAALALSWAELRIASTNDERDLAPADALRRSV